MLRLTCPHCGERDYVEFAYGGDATQRFPDLAGADIDTWTQYVFLRPNPRGAHREYWQHKFGCRQWLVVQRDTVTHAVSSVEAARDAEAPPDAQAARDAAAAHDAPLGRAA